ncbi:MAG: hypothetical protein MUC99_00915 [Anaerolineae bacterium]|nr:hypothetical protein [Anaerolineae bacterium]
MTLEADVTPKPAPVASPLRLPDFRWLWLGGVMVSLGVQFYAVGLVWLVLYLTGSGVQLGGLLTVAAVPRAVSMLLSGLVNGALMTVGLALLGAGAMSMAALFVIAPLSGLVDATFYPANSALVPRLVSKPQLANANALIQTADTLANIAGRGRARGWRPVDRTVGRFCGQCAVVLGRGAGVFAPEPQDRRGQPHR